MFRKPAITCLLALLLATAAFNLPLLGGRFYFSGTSQGSDIIDFHYPVKSALHESLRQHRLPLWTPYIHNGFPLLAEGQVAPFFLPNALLFFLFKPLTALSLTYLYSFFFTGLFTFLFLRNLRLARLPALFGGLAFAFCGFTLTHVQHPNFLQAVMLLPLELLLVDLCVSRGGLWLPAVFAAVASQQIFAGSFQIATYSLSFSGVYFLYRGASSLKLAKFAAAAGVMAGCALLGGLTCAVQLLPMKELVVESYRSGLPQDHLADAFHLPLRMLAGVLSPYFFTGMREPAAGGVDDVTFIETLFYPGLIALALCAFAFLSRARLKDNLFWLAAAVGSLLLALGSEGPLLFALRIPGLSNFRVPARFTMLTDLAIAVLAAAALDGALSRWRSRAAAVGAAVLAALQCADMLVLHFRLNPTVSVEWLERPPQVARFLEEHIGADRFQGMEHASFVLGAWVAAGKRRAQNDELKKVQEIMAYDFNMVYKLRKPTSYTQLFLKGSLEFELSLIAGMSESGGRLSIPGFSKRLMQAAAVRFFVAPVRIQEDPDFKEVFSTENGMYVYEFTKALPRARFVTGARRLSPIDAFAEIVTGTSDLGATVFLSAAGDERAAAGAEARIEIVEDDPDRVAIAADVPVEGWLVLSDTHYPGWMARVDGEEREILRANAMFRAVQLPAGRHDIVFTYEPESFRAGVRISLLALAAILLVFIVGIVRSWKRSPKFGVQD